ncbi:cob(I)alamin adenosyltransferase [Prochlorococcus marinus str. MIT 9211]|uniref:Cob(I)alamin adenosyltransferase n=1 Tax=Prochlorococcus marinus (strain MIT 9211) TaxID=93059 RepID=A9BDL5_PROM4|nr:cob(I)alamin adenosyltransferase [Prochlorococcus marinus str. MIT 9211]
MPLDLKHSYFSFLTASPSYINKNAPEKDSNLRSIPFENPKPILRIVEPQGQLQVHMANFGGSFPVVLSEALRSAGLGSEVLIAQLLKGGVDQGPSKGIQLCGRLHWIRPDLPCYLGNEQSIADHLSSQFIQAKQAVQAIWQICQQNLLKENIHKLVLDEVGLAIKLGFVQETDLIETLEQRPRAIDVILTGPFIPKEVVAMADQVTELRCSK